MSQPLWAESSFCTIDKIIFEYFGNDFQEKIHSIFIYDFI